MTKTEIFTKSAYFFLRDQLKAIQAVRSGAVCIDSTGISQISEIHTDQLFDSIGRFARKQANHKANTHTLSLVLFHRSHRALSLSPAYTRAYVQVCIDTFEIPVLAAARA